MRENREKEKEEKLKNEEQSELERQQYSSKEGQKRHYRVVHANIENSLMILAFTE